MEINTINKTNSIQKLEGEIKRLRHKLEGQDKEVKELHHVYMHTIRAFASAIDSKDHYTYDHSINVVKYAVAIAHQMKLTNHEIQDIKHACQLHDLGKIGVPDYILAKHGKLNKEEWEKVKIHTLKGAEILSPLKFLDGIIKLIMSHHERYDGSGYPKGLKGKKIPLGARIMLVADAFDAMTSDRPYRKKLIIKEAIEELKKNSGTQFDPEVVKTFLEVLRVEPGIVGIKGNKKICFLLQASP